MTLILRFYSYVWKPLINKKNIEKYKDFKDFCPDISNKGNRDMLLKALTSGLTEIFVSGK
jgi:hypothetical protein